MNCAGCQAHGWEQVTVELGAQGVIWSCPEGNGRMYIHSREESRSKEQALERFSGV